MIVPHPAPPHPPRCPGPGAPPRSRRGARALVGAVLGWGAAATVAVAEAPRPDTVPVPAGRFQQGSAREPDAPPRTVSLPAFHIDRHEVTVADFARFVSEGGYRDTRHWSTAGREWLASHPEGAGADARAAGRAGDHPVVAVTLFEAEAYCAWAGGRLPTEAEWERAACGTDGRRFPWGDSEEVAAAWYAGGKFGSLQRVATVPAHDQAAGLHSPTGTLHMAGNVWEWTADRYHARDWGGTGTDAPRSTADTPWHVLRGGSFMNLPSYSTCRHREPARPDRTAFTVGFRCVRDSL